ncbi:DUF1559 domain-containing protein [Rhodopirellula sp. MGV]|uniref:DUF1559 family PulG-like putative transporter n=1 Tax=Rhodopirellula sp. MGV TaxID=2023130 RepID=UPI000B97C317|nr:DUF1559 domain-containing protein [Rhodopirellula sp. MGV]OYP30379.1 hypothetical protein CGZ80_23185 [Rhodopirellula sp. MGV]PNY34735.1 DUF1559 domain-containing protein [Rhodopirellula baltica]
MPLLFTCPHCSAKTQVEDRYSGQSGECFSCGSPIEIPDFAGVQEVSAPAKARRPVGAMLAAGVVLMLLVSLVFSIIQFGGGSVSRLAEIRTQRSSISKLEVIASAMNAYAADYGAYPPPASKTSGGTVMHSWRVLLLPYLGERELYSRFDLTKPWNHPVNLEAAYEMPDAYLHPGDNSGMLDRSGYYLVVGPGTLFPPSGPLGPRDVTDKSAQTILVIAARPPNNQAFNGWTEPVDYDFSKMQGTINSGAGLSPGGFVESGATVATVDGRGHFLSKEMLPQTFKALVTPRGNEPLPDDTLD